MDRNYTLDGLEELDQSFLEDRHDVRSIGKPYHCPSREEDLESRLIQEIQRQGALTRLFLNEQLKELARLVAGEDTFEESVFADDK